MSPKAKHRQVTPNLRLGTARTPGAVSSPRIIWMGCSAQRGMRLGMGIPMGWQGLRNGGWEAARLTRSTGATRCHTRDGASMAGAALGMPD